mmetsp:Transcript_27529/g.91543  ORF Transcript_27529/g.91543 Transcript_27529/m.91543 type:complete len:243 (-) Transcript_27529:1394-2122(-)
MVGRSPARCRCRTARTRRHRRTSAATQRLATPPRGAERSGASAGAASASGSEPLSAQSAKLRARGARRDSRQRARDQARGAAWRASRAVDPSSATQVGAAGSDVWLRGCGCLRAACDAQRGARAGKPAARLCGCVYATRAGGTRARPRPSQLRAFWADRASGRRRVWQPCPTRPAERRPLRCRLLGGSARAAKGAAHTHAWELGRFAAPASRWRLSQSTVKASLRRADGRAPHGSAAGAPAG